jgi:hypothetical protein
MSAETVNQTPPAEPMLRIEAEQQTAKHFYLLD